MKLLRQAGSEILPSSWVKSGAAVTSLNGGLATTSRATVHVSDSNGELLGRIALESLEPLDDWKAPRKVVEIIRQLQKEDRL